MTRAQGLGEGPSYLCINALLPLGLPAHFSDMKVLYKT